MLFTGILMNLLGLIYIVIFFSFINLKVVLANKILIAVDLLILTSFLIDLLIYASRKIGRLRILIKKIIPEKIINFFRELSYYDGKVFRQSVFYGIIFSLVGVAFLNYILFQALELRIGLLNYLTVIFLIAIISSVPISINNIGIKEWAYITFFGLFGLNPAAVLTVAIISRIIQMVISFAALPIYLKRR